MKIVTAEEMRAIDRATTEKYGVPSLTLMENAAHGALDTMSEWLTNPGESEIVIICGTGNNGGDGMALARLLIEQSHNITVFLAGDKSKLSADAKSQYEILSNSTQGDDADVEFWGTLLGAEMFLTVRLVDERMGQDDHADGRGDDDGQDPPQAEGHPMAEPHRVALGPPGGQ